MRPKFIADVNVGKLARRLRMMGYDTLFINGVDDDELVRVALREDRVLLTKDKGIMQRRIVALGEVTALLIEDDRVGDQLRQVVGALDLGPDSEPFSRCMECNEVLVPRNKNELQGVVPPYVFKTQDRFVQCPGCERIYWRGTHWQRMSSEVESLTNGPSGPASMG